MLKENSICANAASHTLMSNNIAQFGLSNVVNPNSNPGNVMNR